MSKTAINCWNYVQSLDYLFDDDHGSEHCYKVWQWITNHYKSSISEMKILEVAAAFHEQADDKFTVGGI